MNILGPKSRAGFRENPLIEPIEIPTAPIDKPIMNGAIPLLISVLVFVAIRIEIINMHVPNSSDNLNQIFSLSIPGLFR